METKQRVELELEKLIQFVADNILEGKLKDDETIPDLDTCATELRVLMETYVAIMIRNDKRF